MKPKRATSKKPGRPRQFDTDRALQCAMEVFWRKGFEAASMPDLTRAMRINRPSLYAAFGNKQQLFRRALDRYAGVAATFVTAALEKPTVREMIEHIFQGAVEFLSAKNHPRGCLLLQGAPLCGDSADPIRKQILAHRLAGEIAIRNRLRQAQKQGYLTRKIKPTDFAKFISALINGISIQAANGASRAELQTLAEMAIRACRDDN